MPESLSNISSRQFLYVVVNDLGRLKLTLQYIVKLKAKIDNPAFDCVFNPLYENLYGKNKKCIKSIGFRNKKHIDDIYTFRYY